MEFYLCLVVDFALHSNMVLSSVLQLALMNFCLLYNLGNRFVDFKAVLQESHCLEVHLISKSSLMNPPTETQFCYFPILLATLLPRDFAHLL